MNRKAWQNSLRLIVSNCQKLDAAFTSFSIFFILSVFKCKRKISYVLFKFNLRIFFSKKSWTSASLPFINSICRDDKRHEFYFHTWKSLSAESILVIYLSLVQIRNYLRCYAFCFRPVSLLSHCSHCFTVFVFLEIFNFFFGELSLWRELLKIIYFSRRPACEIFLTKEISSRLVFEPSPTPHQSLNLNLVVSIIQEVSPKQELFTCFLFKSLNKNEQE